MQLFQGRDVQPLVWVFAFGLFLFINAPSVKIFTLQGPYINVLAFLFVVSITAARLYESRYTLERSHLLAATLIGLAFALIVLPEYLGLRSGSVASLTDAVSLLLILCTIIAILPVATKQDVRSYLALQVVWAAIIGLALLIGVLDPRGHDVYHYNTVSLPMALGLCVVIGYLVYPDAALERWQRFGLIAVPAITLPALVSQHGRSAYVGLFGVIVVSVTLIAATNSRETAIKTLRRATAAFSIGVVSLLLLIWLGFVSRLFVDRMTALFTDLTSLGRFELYRLTVERILAAPFGHGLGAFDHLSVHSYPHNLFLHAAFAGGILAGLLLLAGVLLLLVEYLVAFFETPTAPVLCIGLIGAYLLFTFSISYSITHTYMFFTAAALCASISTPDPTGSVQGWRPRS